ncbi:MAG: thymidylate synthase [Nanoarchaeota archaeon]|nr:thymidylate synthase [Nanoarchaeota archaeon]
MEKGDRHPEHQYLDILKDIMDNGFEKTDFATGTKIKSVFGRMMRYDLSKGFPLLTTKKVFMRGIIHELIWFIKGATNVKYLVDNEVHIWDDWPFKAYKKAMEKGEVPALTQEELIKKIKELPESDPFVQKWGELGPVYGRQWRKWQASNGKLIDQLAWAVWKSKNYPDRKHVCVSAWNPEFIYEMSEPGSTMAIPPCHAFYNINVTNGKLSLALYQRSCDIFLGVPFNIASYSLLTMILAQICGYQPGEFIHFLGDTHIYGNHYEQVKEQISREPKPFPKIWINPEKKNLDDFTIDDFKLIEYESHPPIKGEITVVGGFNEKDREFDKKSS